MVHSRLSFLLALTLAGSFLAGAEEVKHSNGVVAYRGQGSRDQKITHSTDQVAWYGPGALDDKVYYSNGRVAWNGPWAWDQKLYHSDGSVLRNDPVALDQKCYRPDGSVLKENCKSISVPLGSGINMLVRHDGNKGYWITLDVLGTLIPVRE